jgi:hypothetical protein
MPTDQAWTARYKETQRLAGREWGFALSPIYRDVILALNTYEPPPDGSATPSEMDLAEVAFCSIRTVQRALKKAKQLGLLGGPFK